MLPSSSFNVVGDGKICAPLRRVAEDKELRAGGTPKQKSLASLESHLYCAEDRKLDKIFTIISSDGFFSQKFPVPSADLSVTNTFASEASQHTLSADCVVNTGAGTSASTKPENGEKQKQSDRASTTSHCSFCRCTNFLHQVENSRNCSSVEHDQAQQDAHTCERQPTLLPPVRKAQNSARGTRLHKLQAAEHKASGVCALVASREFFDGCSMASSTCAIECPCSRVLVAKTSQNSSPSVWSYASPFARSEATTNFSLLPDIASEPSSLAHALPSFPSSFSSSSSTPSPTANTAVCCSPTHSPTSRLVRRACAAHRKDQNRQANAQCVKSFEEQTERVVEAEARHKRTRAAYLLRKQPQGGGEPPQTANECVSPQTCACLQKSFSTGSSAKEKRTPHSRPIVATETKSFVAQTLLGAPTPAAAADMVATDTNQPIGLSQVVLSSARRTAAAQQQLQKKSIHSSSSKVAGPAATFDRKRKQQATDVVWKKNPSFVFSRQEQMGQDSRFFCASSIAAKRVPSSSAAAIAETSGDGFCTDYTRECVATVAAPFAKEFCSTPSSAKRTEKKRWAQRSATNRDNLLSCSAACPSPPEKRGDDVQSVLRQRSARLLSKEERVGAVAAVRGTGDTPGKKAASVASGRRRLRKELDASLKSELSHRLGKLLRTNAENTHDNNNAYSASASFPHGKSFGPEIQQRMRVGRDPLDSARADGEDALLQCCETSRGSPPVLTSTSTTTRKKRQLQNRKDQKGSRAAAERAFVPVSASQKSPRRLRAEDTPSPLSGVRTPHPFLSPDKQMRSLQQGRKREMYVALADSKTPLSQGKKNKVGENFFGKNKWNIPTGYFLPPREAALSGSCESQNTTQDFSEDCTIEGESTGERTIDSADDCLQQIRESKCATPCGERWCEAPAHRHAKVRAAGLCHSEEKSAESEVVRFVIRAQGPSLLEKAGKNPRERISTGEPFVEKNLGLGQFSDGEPSSGDASSSCSEEIKSLERPTAAKEADTASTVEQLRRLCKLSPNAVAACSHCPSCRGSPLCKDNVALKEEASAGFSWRTAQHRAQTLLSGKNTDEGRKDSSLHTSPSVLTNDENACGDFSDSNNVKVSMVTAADTAVSEEADDRKIPVNLFFQGSGRGFEFRRNDDVLPLGDEIIDTTTVERDCISTSPTLRTVDGSFFKEDFCSPLVTALSPDIRENKRASAVLFHHKILRPSPQRQHPPEFDIGLYLIRAAALSKHPDDVDPCLEDEELMADSIVVKSYLLEPSPSNMHRNLFDRFDKRKFLADIPRVDDIYYIGIGIKEASWYAPEGGTEGTNKLEKQAHVQKLLEQQDRWNPFSIFGSSLPCVDLEDIFDYKVYSCTAPSARTSHPLIRRLYQFYQFQNIWSTITFDEWEKVRSAFKTYWKKQYKFDLDWRNDPATVEEFMWMLEANGQTEDKSLAVFGTEICYCVTPNPAENFAWNDPRCHRYKAPRPSMSQNLQVE